MSFQKRNWEQFEELKEEDVHSLNKVGTPDLIGRFKSKSDLYIYFTEILGYYLPPLEYVNRDFIRQVLKGEKSLIKMNDVKMIRVPKYEELSIKILLKSIKDDSDIRKHLSDQKENSKPID